MTWHTHAGLCSHARRGRLAHVWALSWQLPKEVKSHDVPIRSPCAPALEPSREAGCPLPPATSANKQNRAAPVKYFSTLLQIRLHSRQRVQVKRGIAPWHSSLPSTQEQRADSYWVRGPRRSNTNHAWVCWEKGFPGAHTSSEVKPREPAGFAAGTGSSTGSEGLAKTALQGRVPRGTLLSPSRALSALLHV